MSNAQVNRYTRQWLDHWHGLLGGAFEPWESEQALGPVLHELRRVGRVREALAILPHGDAVADAVEEVFASLDHGPRGVSDDVLIDWVRQWCDFADTILARPEVCRSFNVERGADPLDACAEATGYVTVAEDLEGAVVDCVDDMLSVERSPESYAAYFFLSEPLYFLDRDYRPAHHAAWPILADHVEIDANPFRPLFELWRERAYCVYLGDSAVRILAPVAGSHPA